MQTPSFNTASGKYYCNPKFGSRGYCEVFRFNTASGKYYCNSKLSPLLKESTTIVSIPQAVSTIAISMNKTKVACNAGSFNTVNGKYYCNMIVRAYAL